MSQLLSARLDDVRRRLKRSAILRGVALVVIVATAGVVVAGGVDYLLRLNSMISRMALTACAFLPAILVFRRVLLPPLRTRLSDVDIARRLERQDPSWAGHLSSAAAFADRVPLHGSVQLQQAIVDRATDRLAVHPLVDLIDSKRLERTVIGSFAAVVLLLMIGLLAPSISATAIARLAVPFANIEWPRSVDLLLVAENNEPLASKIQVGQGQTFRFTIRNRKGPVPEDLTLQIVEPAGRRRSEPIPIAEGVEATDHEHNVGIGSFFANEGPLRFRVVGGDDRDMPFITADVVTPPVFEQIEVTVTPPKYLRDVASQTSSGTGGVTGIVGSSVSVEAVSSKPLESAELHLGEEIGPAVTLDRSGQRVTTSFTLTEAGTSSYWFGLKDKTGFENPQAPRYEIRATADLPPEVTILEPADNLQVTAVADLPILVEATDDHGLMTVQLRYGREGVFAGSDSQSLDDRTTVIGLAEQGDRPKQGTYPLIWSLEPLLLSPGDRLTFRGEAMDAYDLGPPHVGVSSPRTITVVSAVDKREELLDRQSKLLSDLVQAQRDEERLRGAVDELAAQLERVGELRPEDHDLLARAEFEQRRVAASLTEPRTGIERRAERALIELKANRIDDDSLARRFERIAQELASLRNDALPATDRDLVAARKGRDPKAVEAQLATARSNLNVVMGSLDSLLKDLGAWQNRRDLGTEVSDLFANQRELAEATAKATAETLGTNSGQLSDQQAANLETLGLRQSGLADRLSRLATSVQELAGTSGSQNDSDPDETDPNTALSKESSTPDRTVKEASELLQSSALPATARAAGESIRGNQLGEAGRLQTELLSKLAALRELLSKSASTSLDTESLRQTAAKLDSLEQAQQAALEELRKANDDGEGLSEDARDQLRRDQAGLREATTTAAREFRAAGADQAAESLAKAAQQMADALERLLKRNDAAAERSLEQALEELRNAKREAEQAENRINEQLAQEMATQSVELLKVLAERQQALNGEVARLAALAAERGSLSRSQLLTLRQTATTQGTIAEETSALAMKLQAAKAVAVALQSAVDHMRLLEQALGDRETGEAAQKHGQTAKERLVRTIAALEPNSDDSESSDTPPEANAERGSGEESELISVLAQLELLRDLQIDLRQRTEELDQLRRDGELAPDQQSEAKRLGEQQELIRKALVELIVSAAEAVQESETP